MSLVQNTLLPIELDYAFKAIIKKYGTEKAREIIKEWASLVKDPTELYYWRKSFSALKTGLTYPKVSPSYQIYRETYHFRPYTRFYLDYWLNNLDDITIAEGEVMSLLIVPEKTFAKAVKEVFNHEPANQLGLPVYEVDTEITAYGDWVTDVSNAWVLLDDKIVDPANDVAWSFARVQAETARHIKGVYGINISNDLRTWDVDELVPLIKITLDEADNFQQD